MLASKLPSFETQNADKPCIKSAALNGPNWLGNLPLLSAGPRILAIHKTFRDLAYKWVDKVKPGTGLACILINFDRALD